MGTHMASTATGADPATCTALLPPMSMADRGLTLNLTRRAWILGPSARSTNPDIQMSTLCNYSSRRIA
jgi:hypothetical protein